MKTFILAVVAVLFAAISFATVAEARGGTKWRYGGGWRNGGNHHAWRHNGYRHGYRHHGWRHHRHGYRHGRYYGGYWGPGIVFAPGYYGGDPGYYGDDYEPVCYVRRVQRFDQNGNAYVRRVRVCD